MRLASFLPMLLLLASPLAAQQNCQITDLTASVVQFNQSTCEFFVVLDFQYAGVSNQFGVRGNGNNYGLFTYGQLPITLGPFMANPNAPTVMEFIVQDAVFQDCSDATEIAVPPCTGVLCDIDSLTVDVGNCDPILGTYVVTVDFETSTLVGGFFELYAAGGVLVGTFPVASLPVTVVNFPWGGNPIDILKVCLVNQPNCCKSIEFQAPNCSGQGCGIVDLTVTPGDCLTDSTYKAVVNFSLVNSSPSPDSFQLFINDQPAGFYGINQAPLPIVVTANGGFTDVVRVCAVDATGALCCKEKEFAVPPCMSPCAIQNLIVEADTCSSDSTFGLWINFYVADSTVVDSFALWGNGQPIGHFGLNQLPLYLPNFEWNGLIFNTIKVCTGNQNPCCRELQFLAPNCLPFDSTCEITHLFVDTGACTSDSTYKLLLNFNATNPGNGTFIVYANGAVLDTFNLNEAPLTILDFPWNGGNNDVVTVCLGGGTPGTVGGSCCKTKEFQVPNCLLPCDVFDLQVQVTGDCDPATHTYPVKINFHTSNPGNDLFDVFVNGDIVGTFPLNQLPVSIQVPADSFNLDVIQVCINDQPNCCAAVEVHAPNCDSINCDIFDLQVQVGDCNPAGGYQVTVNFEVVNPDNDFFEVWAGSQYLGIFPLNQLPLVIPNFPASGNPFDAIKICINDQPNCCAFKEFQAPTCGGCEIVNLHVDTGDCNADSTYNLWVNFQVLNSTSTQFVLWGNGQQLGVFDLSQLPLNIPNFPWDGQGPNDFIKVCIGSNSNVSTCCEVLEFPTPDCFQHGDCNIFDLHVETGACTSDSTYVVVFNFGVTNPPANEFGVLANGQFLGNYNLNQLPVTIQDFPWNGGNHDVLKVCFESDSITGSACCEIVEFAVPDCLTSPNDCEIFDLVVDPGACTSDSTYSLVINFQVQNALFNVFGVWANGQLLGTFNLNQLPLTIPDFPWNGGNNDVVKVCLLNPNGVELCCKTKEFPVPNCLGGADCDITDLHVETGACTSDSSYVLSFNFNVANPPSNVFGVWANGQFLGLYGLGQLPVTIPNFPWNGGNNDLLKVCFSNNAGTAPECCESIEFAVPDCLTDPSDCEIFDLVVETGDCTSDSTYSLFVNFQVQNQLFNVFGVWANGQLLGTFNLNQLPLTIPNFPWNGGNNDVIKVCMLNPNGLELCCKVKEFAVPDCLGGGDCEIVGMVVDPGDCTSDSTYSLFLNFQVNNPPGNVFGVWANGQFLGSFNLNMLPLNFPNFPWNGGQNDVVKVCFINNGAFGCCKTVEFPVPDCLGNDPCHIYDMVAVRTACLCGQFFVAVTFEHNNGGGQGFQIGGNGQNYGTFPYNTQQPIILGPFPGDGTTNYEFVVSDVLHPDCHDFVEIGEVECQTPVIEPGSGTSMTIAPNPASSWVNVTAMLENGAEIGQATVKVYHADGRLVNTLVVGNAANFQLDVSQYPAGVYRLSVLAAGGRLEGSFTKQ